MLSGRCLLRGCAVIGSQGGNPTLARPGHAFTSVRQFMRKQLSETRRRGLQPVHDVEGTSRSFHSLVGCKKSIFYSEKFLKSFFVFFFVSRYKLTPEMPENTVHFIHVKYLDDSSERRIVTNYSANLSVTFIKLCSKL